jgi:hypothetical protein
MDERKWRFRSRDSGFERVTRLWLYREIDGSLCDDADDQAGSAAFKSRSATSTKMPSGHPLIGNKPSEKWVLPAIFAW